jgi:hypothetical protein
VVRRLAFPIAVLALTAIIVLSLVFYFTTNKPLSRTTPKVTLGDACLVGGWTLRHEDYHFNSATTHVVLSGLSGALLTITPSGTATLSYDPSAPEIGHTNSLPESLLLRGSLVSLVHASNGSLSINPVTSHVRQFITINGKIQPPQILPAPAITTAAYKCSGSQLLISVQATTSGYTDVFVRTP